jgi:hypothetical protein
MPILQKRPEGLSEQVFQAANAYSDGRKSIPQDMVRVTRRGFFHRQIVANAGNTNLSFFQSQAFNKYVCNLNNGRLNNDQFFILNSIMVDIDSGVTAAGALAAAGAQVGGGVTYVVPQTAIEALRATAKNALLTLSVGNQIVAQAYGLHTFPSGGGLVAFPALSNVGALAASATTGRQDVISLFNNGNADAGNAYTLPPYPIVPGRDVSLTIEWQALITLTNDIALSLRPVLNGVLFELPNN